VSEPDTAGRRRVDDHHDRCECVTLAEGDVAPTLIPWWWGLLSAFVAYGLLAASAASRVASLEFIASMQEYQNPLLAPQRDSVLELPNTSGAADVSFYCSCAMHRGVAHSAKRNQVLF